MGNIYMDFEGMIQLLVGYSAFVGHPTKHESTKGQYNVQVKAVPAHATLHLFLPRDQINLLMPELFFLF